MARPIAGTWDVATPAVILAIALAPRVGPTPRRRPPTLEHHPRVVLLAHPGHRRRGVLEALSVGGEDLCQEVDVASERDHAVVVPVEHGLLLLLGHGPFVQEGPFPS